MSKIRSTSQTERSAQKQRSRDRHIDQLLLGIISANPHHDETQTLDKRLVTAREALLGEKPPPGRPQINDELAMFHILAEVKKESIDRLSQALQHLRDPELREVCQREIDRPAKSERSMALEQSEAASSHGMLAEGSVVDRLRRKVRNANFSSQDMADLEGLVHCNSPRARQLEHVFECLRSLGIKARSVGQNPDS